MTDQQTSHHTKLINEFLHRPVHIYGATGAEGYAILEWLHAEGAERIIAHDFSPDTDALVAEWRRVHETATEDDENKFIELVMSKSITWLLGPHYSQIPAPGDILFVAQSWFRYAANAFLKPYFTETLDVRPEYIDSVWTLTRLYFALFPGKLIAVTGSDGKTTTTRMIGAIMSRHAMQQNVTCLEMGNDRTHTQSIAAVAAASEKDFLILEVSDRQLSFNFPLIPDIAVVTNVTPNKHMDDYGGFDNYVQKKGNLLRYQTARQSAILNADNEPSVETLVDIGAGARQWISLRRKPESGMWCDGEMIYRVYRGDQVSVMPVRDIGVLGRHNWYNAACAIAATLEAGVAMETAVAAIKEFKGVQHRLQPIRVWQRITFVEDSAGGNPANIPVTIETFNKQPLVIIIGGYRQNLTIEEIEPIVRALDGHHTVHSLLLMGQVAPDLKELLEQAVATPVSMNIVKDLQGALEWVRAHAADITRSRDAVVCMTPAFESFDQYKDYRARADHFVQLVNELPV